MGFGRMGVTNPLVNIDSWFVVNMLKLFKGGWFWLLLITWLFLAIIKLHDYDRAPGSAHAEELLYGWSGIHLIETGKPQSWSTLDYPDENLVYDGIVGDKNGVYLPAKLYEPWLDEPPLYSLLAGGVSHLYGDDRSLVLPTSHTRIPSVLASLVTMGLVFWVGYQFFGYWIGYLAMIFYGVTPIFVLGARMSVPENIIALFVLMCLALMPRYESKGEKWIAGVFGLLALVGGLMKPTGFFIAPLMMFVAARKRRWNDVWIILGWTLVGIALFLLYGYYLDWELFKTIVAIQGVRFAGWTGLSHVLNTPAYDIFLMFDGWYVFSMLSAIYFAWLPKKSKEVKWIVLFWVYWLMVAIFSGTEQDLLPWYRYPMFPLLSLFGSLGLIKILFDADFVGMAFAVGTLLTGRYFLHNAFRATTDPNVFRYTYLLLVSPSLLGMIWDKPVFKGLTRVFLVAVVMAGIYYNATFIYSIFSIQCENLSCPFGPSTWLSEVRIPFFWRLFTVVK